MGIFIVLECECGYSTTVRLIDLEAMPRLGTVDCPGREFMECKHSWRVGEILDKHGHGRPRIPRYDRELNPNDQQ